jgi:hypothetical protein
MEKAISDSDDERTGRIYMKYVQILPCRDDIDTVERRYQQLKMPSKRPS